MRGGDPFNGNSDSCRAQETEHLYGPSVRGNWRGAPSLGTLINSYKSVKLENPKKKESLWLRSCCRIFYTDVTMRVANLAG
jgi:hypothetical protein